MGRHQRAKGARGEREVCHLFAEHGMKAIRSAPLQAGCATNAPDVQVRELPMLWTEVKRMKRVPVSSSFKQAARDATATDGHRVPVLAFREDGCEWLAAVRLDDLLGLLASAVASGQLPSSFSAPSSTSPSQPSSQGR